MPTLAYSYARFSSTAQGEGDSERRQLDAARQYVEEKGFLLDESLGVDRGLSGFSGENLSEGVLREFVRQCKAGKIPRGSALLIENPDRLSRQKFAQAYAKIYQPVLEANIELHFVSLRCVLRPNHSFVDLLQVGVEIDRATSESAAKSERLGKAWAQKKHLSEPGIAITGAMPAWLLGKNGEPIRVDEQKAETVQLIFRMAASGMGKRLIARRLNERKTRPGYLQVRRPARTNSQSVRRSGHRREHGASHALAGQRQALPPEAGYRFERREWSYPEHHCLRRFRSRLPDLARSTGLVERHRYRRFGGDPAVRGTNRRTEGQHRGGFSENRDDYRCLNRFAFPGAKSAATDDRDSCSQPYVRVVGHGSEADRGLPSSCRRRYASPKKSFALVVSEIVTLV
jgi:DNA invertase Pin-like site-specific DNA recombinase